MFWEELREKAVQYEVIKEASRQLEKMNTDIANEVAVLNDEVQKLPILREIHSLLASHFTVFDGIPLLEELKAMMESRKRKFDDGQNIESLLWRIPSARNQILASVGDSYWQHVNGTTTW